MRLYLLRHGKAEARATWEADDALRPLTDEGREATRRAARGLAALDLGIERVLTSPFARARETALLTAEALALAAEEVEEVADLAPGCDLDGFNRMLCRIGPAQNTLLVGHEPDFSTLVGLLIAGRQGAGIDFKKGACCCVELPERVAEVAAGHRPKVLGKGELVWLLTARQLGLMAPVSATPRRAPAAHARKSE